MLGAGPAVALVRSAQPHAEYSITYPVEWRIDAVVGTPLANQPPLPVPRLARIEP
ncbi:hypothetical protein [Ramlibacter sp.]|uniref:hypothetical protein n=1 Tax=Ramlibacter sp. TaxID=1917967 RepID=UPI002BECC352|nr:hypothetical protein [Ramlibacter sp.]HWI83129.1 hypothetical protein [Ramlibacter sp.]